MPRQHDRRQDDQDRSTSSIARNRVSAWCRIRPRTASLSILPDDPAFADLRPLFPPYPGARQIISIDVTRTSTSCGFAVPVYELREERQRLVEWSLSKGEDGVRDYRRQRRA